MSSTQTEAATLIKSRRAEPGPMARLLWRAVLPIVVVTCGVVIWTGLSPEAIGGVCLLMMLALMGMRVPLGLTMAIPGILGTWAIVGWQASERMLQSMSMNSVSNWALTVLPMFVLMGTLLWRSGLTEHLYKAADLWTSRLPGGLAVGTWVAGAGLASLSGSTLGTVFPLTRAGVPEMLKAGYDRRLALAAVASAGTMAHLIPPGLFLLLYASVASVPVGAQLMAGIIPGLLITALFCCAIIIACLVRPSLAGNTRSRPKVTWKSRFHALAKVWDAPVLVIIVVVGIYGGFITATEAGALGAFGAILICLVRRRKDKPLQAVGSAMLATASTMGAIFLLLIGANMVSRLFSVSGLANGFAKLVVDLEMSRVSFIVAMTIVFIVLGMFMDPMAMMLLTVPVVLPVFDTLGISPIWFGVFIVVFQELAVLTPPVGVLSYVLHGIVQDPNVNVGQRITINDIFVAVMFAIPVALILVALITIFPEIVTWLPDKMGAP